MKTNFQSQQLRSLATVLVLLLSIGNMSAYAATIISDVASTFDTDLDGWTLVPANDTGFLLFSGTIGNPPGSAFFTDGAGGARGTIRAPSKYLGDWSLVEHLQYEHKIIRLGGAPEIDDVLNVTLSGPGGTARFGTDPNSVLPSTEDWVNVVVPIDESFWDVQSGDWLSIIDNVTRLDIEIEMVISRNPPTGTRDQDAIDNIVLAAVPIPAALWLFASGIAGLGLLTHRKRQSGPITA